MHPLPDHLSKIAPSLTDPRLTDVMLEAERCRKLVEYFEFDVDSPQQAETYNKLYNYYRDLTKQGVFYIPNF